MVYLKKSILQSNHQDVLSQKSTRARHPNQFRISDISKQNYDLLPISNTSIAERSARTKAFSTKCDPIREFLTCFSSYSIKKTSATKLLSSTTKPENVTLINKLMFSHSYSIQPNKPNRQKHKLKQLNKQH